VVLKVFSVQLCRFTQCPSKSEMNIITNNVLEHELPMEWPAPIFSSRNHK
jgi:hypothetical protein